MLSPNSAGIFHLVERSPPFKLVPSFDTTKNNVYSSSALKNPRLLETQSVSQHIPGAKRCSVWLHFLRFANSFLSQLINSR